VNLRGIPLPVLQIGALLLPGAYVLRLALLAGPLPDLDYWTILASVIDHRGFTPELSAWIRPENEHLLILTRLIYALNVLLSGGHNVGLALWAWGAAFAQGLLLLWLVRRTLFGTPALHLVLALAVGLLVFSPRGWHNWLMGMSGVAWITANLFTVAALTALYRSNSNRSITWLAVSLGCGILATATYSTGLGLWPALVILAFLLGLPPKQLAAVVLSAIAAMAVYAVSYDRPSAHPELQQSIALAGDYLLIFLGGAWAMDAQAGRLIGVGGLVLSLVLWILFLRRDSDLLGRAAPWIAVQAYTLANGNMAALARSGFGPEQALSSRYASLPALFWIGLFALGSLALPALWRKPLITACLACTLILLAVRIFEVSREPTAAYLARAELKPLAAASLYSGARDLALLEKTVAPANAISFLVRSNAVHGLRRIGHVPFGRLFQDCPRPGETIAARSLPDNWDKGPRGELYMAELKGQNTLRLHGWASSDSSNPACVAFANEGGVIRGVAATGYPRTDVAAAMSRVTRSDSGWKGYAVVSPEDTRIEAFLLPNAPGPWFKLKGSAVLTRPGDVETMVHIVHGQ
jgi:hypothetical protein